MNGIKSLLTPYAQVDEAALPRGRASSIYRLCISPRPIPPTLWLSTKCSDSKPGEVDNCLRKHRPQRVVSLAPASEPYVAGGIGRALR